MVSSNFSVRPVTVRGLVLSLAHNSTPWTTASAHSWDIIAACGGHCHLLSLRSEGLLSRASPSEKGLVPPCALGKSSSIHGSDPTRLSTVVITVARPCSPCCSPSLARHPTWPCGYFTPSLAPPSLLSIHAVCMYKFHYFISFGSFPPYSRACGVTRGCQGLSLF